MHARHSEQGPGLDCIATLAAQLHPLLVRSIPWLLQMKFMNAEDPVLMGASMTNNCNFKPVPTACFGHVRPLHTGLGVWGHLATGQCWRRLSRCTAWARRTRVGGWAGEWGQVGVRLFLDAPLLALFALGAPLQHRSIPRAPRPAPFRSGPRRLPVHHAVPFPLHPPGPPGSFSHRSRGAERGQSGR